MAPRLPLCNFTELCILCSGLFVVVLVGTSGIFLIFMYNDKIYVGNHRTFPLYMEKQIFFIFINLIYFFTR